MDNPNVKKFCLYETQEVVEEELKACYENHNEDYVEKATKEFIDDEIGRFMSDMKDAKTIAERFQDTIEDDDGNIWILARVFNVNRFIEKTRP